MSSLPQANPMPEARTPTPKPRVLFLNTRSALGADVAVHLMLLQYFDPEQVEVHIATNRNAVDVDKTLAILRRIPHLKIVVCDLGNEMAGKSPGLIGKLKAVRRNLRAVLSLVKLAWYIVRNRIDVLHAGDRPRDALFSTLLAKATGRRNILHLHIKWYPEIGRATTWALQQCTGIIAISDFTRRSLIEGGLPDAKIFTVLNATDATVFDPAKARRGLLRTRFSLNSDTPIIGIVARIMVWKGHLELVEALALVRKEIPNVRLMIVGREDRLAVQSAESYAGQVRKRIAELGLEANIYWAGWYDETPEVMADLDVLAVPSWEEPFGLVVTEGMAMERPIVGYATGALPEIVTNGVEGLLVPFKDAQALADALIALLRDPARRAEMGRKGRQRVLRQFTPRRQAAEMEQVYRHLLGANSADAPRLEASHSSANQP